MEITIDSVTYNAKEGQTVLDVARENGVYIPALCWHPRTGKAGRCRACVVEVDGAPGLKEACILEVRDGMVVHNSSERVIKTRKMIVNLLLVDGNASEMLSDVGDKNELAEMATSLGISQPEITIDTERIELDESSAGIVFNPNVCIHCGRCVETCNNNVMHEVLDFAWRGNHSKVIMDDDRPMGKSTCVQCGECVQVCPVPALAFKNAIEHANSTAIKTSRVICPYCGVGCTLEVHTSNNKWLWSTAVEDNWENLPNKGMLCVKGRFGFDYVNHPDRLTSPLIKKNGKFENASWDEAFDLIASKFLELKEKYNPRAFACFSSAKCTNEENYLMNRFSRGVMHTNNIDHCARLCHSSSVAALRETLGSGSMTNSMQEARDSEVIFVIGSNPTWNHPVFGGVLRNAIKNHGVKLILADPRKTDLYGCADIYLNLKNSSDVALLMGMCHIIVRENWIDQEYINDNCEGWDDFKKSLESFTPEFSEEITGIPKDKIYEAAKLYARSSPAAIYWGMGISQHSHGTDNARAVVNLALITGNIGIKGGGVNPLRGQNNVQGASDMGAMPNDFSGYQNVTDEKTRNKFAAEWGVDPADMDSEFGLKATEIIDQCGDEIKMMYIFGENPMLSDPNLHHAEAQLKKLDFLVVQDIFLTETAVLADVVLPGVSLLEKTGTFTNTERRVQLSRQAIEPLSGTKQDYEIIVEIAKRMGLTNFPGTPEEIFDEMSLLTPSYHGMSYTRLEGVGLRWPCTSKDHPGTPIIHADGIVRGKGLLSALEYRGPGEETDDEFPFVLNTGRLLYHWHTGSMTRRARVLDTIAPVAKMEINPSDAATLNIQDGEKVRVVSRRGSIELMAEVTSRTAAGAVYVSFHFAEAAVNLLTNDVFDPVSKIPEYKFCAVRVEKLKGGDVE